nr:hypothetical protein [uncultured Draconibacterium sp.]
MSKLSSYQKLKQRIEQLEKEKHLLIMQPDSNEARKIRFNYKFRSSLSESAMLGTRELGPYSTGGLASLIQQPKPTIDNIIETVKRLNDNGCLNTKQTLKTGRTLIDLFNKEMSDKFADSEKKMITELCGIPVEEVSYYPANVFSFGDKYYRIEGDSIKEIECEFAHYSSLLNTPYLKMPSMCPTEEQLRNAEKDYMKKYGDKVDAYPGFGCIRIYKH